MIAIACESKATIHGLGSHTGVGEEWADDEKRRNPC